MCDMLKHKCYCGTEYDCIDPNWLCPTNNDDEEANLCPTCLERQANEYEEWYYSQEPEDNV